MKALLIPNDNEQSRSVAARIAENLRARGHKVLMPSRCADERFAAVDVLSEDGCFSEAELCIVVGGDGAVLHAGKKAALHEIPVLAVNTGRVGFLTAHEKTLPDDISLAAGIMRREKRSMLDITVTDESGNVRFSDVALNEAVISRGEISRIIDIELLVDGQKINVVRGDGMIISTPTGSTAYSMSAGGPIVAPEVAAMVVTPVCPYTLAARALVFPDSAEVSARVTGLCDSAAALTVDGDRVFPLEKEMTTTVRRSAKTLELLMPEEASFNGKIKTKLFGIK